MELRRPHDLEDLCREIALPDAELGADGSARRQLQDEPATMAPKAWQHDGRRYQQRADGVGRGDRSGAD
jgi:hypothetical protein